MFAVKTKVARAEDKLTLLIIWESQNEVNNKEPHSSILFNASLGGAVKLFYR